MTVKECYSMIGADYDALCKRLGGEAMADRFAVKFLKDSSFSELGSALEKKDWNAVFSAVHTLKGVAANLSITPVEKTASELTEAVRGGKALENMSLYDNVSETYNKAVEALKQCVA